MTELIIIAGLALLLLGPDQLPQIAKSIGKGLREIRKATDDLKGQFEQEMAKIDVEPAHRMIAPVPPPAASVPSTPGQEAQAAAQAAANDPGAARAAARRAAAESTLKVVPPEGAAPADSAAPAVPAAPAVSAVPPARALPPEGTVPQEPKA